MKNAPATRLPIVTGIWFQIHQFESDTGAPSNTPAGMTNILTIECSYPCAKNVAIGNHIATTLPAVERDMRASTAPIVTIQLQSIPFTKAVPQPAVPRA